MVADFKAAKMERITLAILLISSLSVCVTHGDEVKAGSLRCLMKPSGLDSNTKGSESQATERNIAEIMNDKCRKRDFHQVDNAISQEATTKPVSLSFLGSYQRLENPMIAKNSELTPEQLNKRLVERVLREFNFFNMIWRRTFHTTPAEETHPGKKAHIDSLASGLIGRK